MPANLPRLEFQAPQELRQRVDFYCQEVSEKLGRRVTRGEVILAILEDFFAKTRFEGKK